MFGYAALAALAHCGAWAGYVNYLQTIEFENKVRRQAVIRWMDWTKFGPGMQSTSYFNLYLKMQPLEPAPAAVQLLVPGDSRPMLYAYFERHRVGDVVDVWVSRRGRITDIFPPEAPRFWRLLGWLLLTVGSVTFFFVVCFYLVRQSPQVPPEN
jgi:hypothetical protein